MEAVYLHITFMFAIIGECLLESEIGTDFYMSTVLQEYDPLKKIIIIIHGCTSTSQQSGFKLATAIEKLESHETHGSTEFK